MFNVYITVKRVFIPRIYYLLSYIQYIHRYSYQPLLTDSRQNDIGVQGFALSYHFILSLSGFSILIS